MGDRLDHDDDARGLVAPMNRSKPTRWWRRLSAVAELAGDSQQKDIAESLGVSAAAVTKWRQGQLPSPQVVIRAAQVYSQDPQELMAIAFIDSEVDRSGDGFPNLRSPVKKPRKPL